MAWGPSASVLRLLGLALAGAALAASVVYLGLGPVRSLPPATQSALPLPHGVAGAPPVPAKPAKVAAGSPGAAAFAQPPPSQAAAPAEAPSFDIVRIDRQGQAVIAGRGEPGATVTVRNGRRVVGTAKVDDTGSWVLVPDRPFAPGGISLTLSETLADGRDVAGQGNVLLVVPARPKMPLALVEQTPPPPVVLNPGGGAAPRLLAAPALKPANPGGLPLSLDVLDYGKSGAVRFSGRSAPGAVVTVTIDQRPLGTARAGADGSWSLSSRFPIAPGPHRLQLLARAADGREASEILSFKRAATPPQALASGQVVVQPGNNLWEIATHRYGQGIRYTLIFTANRRQIHNPNLIYPGQNFVLPPIPAGKPAP